MDEISKYLNIYIDYLSHIKKYSHHTLRAHRQDIAQFLGYMEANHLIFDKQSIRDFISDIFVRSKNKTTVSRKIYAIKSFFSYLQKKGIIEKNPFDAISSPKIDKKIPEILTVREMLNFLDHLPENNLLELRNKAIFELLYATGLRISELTGLKFTDIDFGGGLIRVMGKGKKERVVPFNDTAKIIMLRYCNERKRCLKKTNDFIFLNSRGEKITDRSVERILRDSFRQIMQSDKHVYPHLFRHSFATHLLQRGANLRVIQELLGHSNLATTEKYTTLNFSDLLRVYKQYHPREQQ